MPDQKWADMAATKTRVAPKQPDRALGQCYLLLLGLAAERNDQAGEQRLILGANGGEQSKKSQDN